MHPVREVALVVELFNGQIEWNPEKPENRETLRGAGWLVTCFEDQWGETQWVARELNHPQPLIMYWSNGQWAGGVK